MSLKYFGTDGIRGTYGVDPITESFAGKIAAGIVSYLRTEFTNNNDIAIVIGRDTRFSGESLSDAFAEVFQQSGVKVLDVGVIPTPQVAFAVTHFHANLGLAITASHNPVSDNGFKLFKSDGTKFTPDQERTIEAHIDNPGHFESSAGQCPSSLKSHLGIEVTKHYFNLLRSVFSSVNLSGTRILVDTANGATCNTTPLFLQSLGAEVITLANQPDGQNINAGVGSEHPDAICKGVVENGCDYGIAHDGDGDRIVLIDKSGELLSGEHFLGIVARYSPSVGCRADRPLITTSMSNYALNAYMAACGIETLRTDVGDRNVAYQMFDHACLLGGENSGHYICADVLKTGDGLVAVLKLFEAIKASGKALTELKTEMQLYPSKLLNLRIRMKLPLEFLLTLQSAVAQAETQIAGKGRILLRYSGTENKLRILVECASPVMLDSILIELEQAARTDLEVI